MRRAILSVGFARRRGGARRTGRRATAFGQRHPGYADVAADKRLAGHAVTLLKVVLGQMLALLGFDRIRMRKAVFDSTSAGAAYSAAAFEGNAALLAQRHPQQ